ncbi:MAG TPA: ABC transporter permease [Rhizomicrobium sp.]|nr:ABC transporter permease [Rhizomicrobium sp.]
MFRNYLITALRSFARYKLYSFINIAGLTVGLTCAIFIVLLLRDELSYDRWIPGTDNFYRIEQTFHVPGQPPLNSTSASFPMPDAMQAQIPEVKTAVHLEPRRMTVALRDRQFLDHVDVVSPNFFQKIRLPLIQGNPATVFAQPESAVITESMAKKYFGGGVSAIGKTLHVVGGCQFGPGVEGCTIRQADMLVTGLMRDLPHNTQLIGDVFIPNTSTADPMSQTRKQDWLSSSGYGYVELAPGADPKLVEKKFVALIDRSVDLAKLAGMRIAADQIMTPHLTPFRDAHLTSDHFGGMTPGGSWTMVYGFAAIAVLILLVACFNFTNLATARALVRAREISLRKVVGARRGQLVVQFLSESVLIAVISFALALLLTAALLPFFDRIAGKPIAFHFLSDWPLILALLGVAVLTGLVAGAYPALILSGFRPASALRNNAAATHGSGMVRTSLVVVQFAVSIGLGIAALVVFVQISFAHAMDLGLSKDGIVVINANAATPSAGQSMVRALAVDPALKGATLSGDVPFSGNNSNDVINVPGEPASIVMRTVGTGPDFFSIYGVKVLSGRALTWRDMAHPHSPYNVVINESAARRFGFSPESAIGKIFFASDAGRDLTHKVRATIVGVVSDFKFEGDRKFVVPTFFSFISDGLDWISVKVPASGVPQALAAIDRIWHAFQPAVAINRHFLEVDFEKQFLADEQQGKIFGIFVGIAIFIACLGLFGLAAFSTERRTKEIGIRKSFGAKSRDIVLMLLWQFSIPVLVANLIAWPVAYYYLRNWLEGYAYRISLNPFYFVGAGLAALVIAWVTVFAHARRVARANPIHALRYE